MADEPFGRQPQTVVVTLQGELEDVNYWMGQLRQRAEFKGDTTNRLTPNSFAIHHRAVND